MAEACPAELSISDLLQLNLRLIKSLWSCRTLSYFSVYHFTKNAKKIMKLLTCTSPGNFEYGEAAMPEPQSGRAILKIKRVGICGTDLHAFEGTQPYFNYPRILGHELAAELIDADDLFDFEIGESVTFTPYFYCGKCIACRNGKTNCCASLQVSGVHIDGGMVEYLSVPSYSLVHGQGLGLDALALVEPFAIGAHAIKRAEVKRGEFALIVGAGPIGLGTMEFAKLAGANVIALDVNKDRLKFCKEKLGVRHTINGMEENVLERLKEITNGDMPTLVMDATGNLRAINDAFQYVAHGGRFVLVGLQKEPISISHPEFHKREATLMSSRNATHDDFEFVVNSIKEGLINPTKFITHRVPFDAVKREFPSWLDPSNGVIKAMVEMG
jgi:2-desacetyl-2-hydroxyethyl bacteriochlorophyllide A dehydrogenase